MLTDPENPSEEWTFEVLAPDEATARTQCQFIADQNMLSEVQNVTQYTKTKNRQGKYKFICWFKSEVFNDNDNN